MAKKKRKKQRVQRFGFIQWQFHHERKLSVITPATPEAFAIACESIEQQGGTIRRKGFLPDRQVKRELRELERNRRRAA